MKKRVYKLSLHQPAGYRIEVVGHLDTKKATWFEAMSLANEFGEDGTPITVLTGEVCDQAMLHGLLNRIRDLGLPLVSVNLVEPDKTSASSSVRYFKQADLKTGGH